MQLKILVFLVAIMATGIGCQQNQQSESKNNLNVGSHTVSVNEVIQANAYTYLRVTENKNEYWMAVAKMDVVKGETLYYDDSMEMTNFTSKDLDRTFDKIYFVQNISRQPLAATSAAPLTSPHGRITSKQDENIAVEPVKGGISIAQLYSGRESYANKTVKIRGQVTKFNASIMGRNWVHVQDGSKDSGKYDLTITTSDVVKVGDVVTFEGNIVLDKDFGAGYSYEIIMEEAKLF